MTALLRYPDGSCTFGQKAHTSTLTLHIGMNIAVERDFYGRMTQNFRQRFHIKSQLDTASGEQMAGAVVVE